MRILERKIFDCTSNNFAFDMKKDKVAKVIAVCKYCKGQETESSNSLEIIVDPQQRSDDSSPNSDGNLL